jgi:hypothetical protein
MRVTNGNSLGWSLLPVGTVHSVQTLKAATAALVPALNALYGVDTTSAAGLAAGQETEIIASSAALPFATHARVWPAGIAAVASGMVATFT